MALFFLAATRMFFLIVLGTRDGEKNREGFGAVLREFSRGGWRWGETADRRISVRGAIGGAARAMRAVVRDGELRGPLWPGWRGFQRFSRVRSPLKGTAFRLAWRAGYSHPGWSATSRQYSHSPFGCTAFRPVFSSARGGAHRSNAQGLGSPVEAYIHIAIARFEWMRPMLAVRIHRHSSELTRRMSTSRLRREASGKRACDGLVRAAAGLAAVFCRGGRRRSPLKCTVRRVVWSAGYPHRSCRREWRRPFGCGQPANPRTRITVHFDGERRGRRADDMPAVTLVQCLKRLRAGTSSAPQSPPHRSCR